MKFGRIVLFFVLLPAVIVFSVWKCVRDTGDIPIRSVPVERIGDGMKFTVTPLKLSSDSHLVFSVRLETYQYPELLDHDFTETAMVVDESGNANVPSKWSVSKKDQYSIVGELEFPVSSNARHFVLTFDEMENVNFEWRLPKKL